MAPGRYISRGLSLGNIAAKRCVKRTQSMSCRSNNSNREICNGPDTKSIDRRSVKKIRSHVFYSKKQARQKPNGRSTESPGTQTQRSNSNGRNQSRIKSSSWKRSDKRGTYVKPWRKKSPNWIAVQPVKQRSELSSPCRLTSSEYRPGTLYSDVVFRGKTALPDPPVILFKKEKFNFSTPLLPDGSSKFEIRKKHYNWSTSNTKINDLEKIPNDEEVDEAFPPLLATNMMPPKNSNKYKSNLKLKLSKSTNYSLKADETVADVVSPNEEKVPCLDEKSMERNSQDVVIPQKGESLIKCDHNELIKTSDSAEVQDLNYSKNFSRRSEASINQIAYGLYLKSQFRQNSDKILHFLNFPSEQIKRSVEGEEWKHKYLPIMNIKLFDNFEHECGFGYSGFNLSRQTFLNFERGDQTFPRFSKHFDDDLYLALEHRAIVSLESALRSSI